MPPPLGNAWGCELDVEAGAGVEDDESLPLLPQPAADSRTLAAIRAKGRGDIARAR